VVVDEIVSPFQLPAISKLITQNKRDISYSDESILSFCKIYGSNYVDLQCTLENHHGETFEDALKWNQKFNKIKSFTPKKWIPSLPQLKFD